MRQKSVMSITSLFVILLAVFSVARIEGTVDELITDFNYTAGSGSHEGQLQFLLDNNFDGDVISNDCNGGAGGGIFDKDLNDPYTAGTIGQRWTNHPYGDGIATNDSDIECLGGSAWIPSDLTDIYFNFSQEVDIEEMWMVQRVTSETDCNADGSISVEDFEVWYRGDSGMQLLKTVDWNTQMAVKNSSGFCSLSSDGGFTIDSGLGVSVIGITTDRVELRDINVGSSGFGQILDISFFNESVSSPELPACAFLDVNCVFYEPFDYVVPVVRNDWFIFPSDNFLTPVAFQLDVDDVDIPSSGKQFRHVIPRVTSPLSSLRFNMHPTDGGYVQAQLSNVEFSGGGVTSEVLTSVRFNDPQGDITAYYTDDFGDLNQFDVCSSCLVNNTQNEVEIDVVIQDTGEQALVENGSAVPIGAQTIKVRVNGNVTAFNIPFLADLDSYSVIDVILSDGDDYVIDDIIVMKGQGGTFGQNDSSTVFQYDDVAEVHEWAGFTWDGTEAGYSCEVNPECCSVIDGELAPDSNWCVFFKAPITNVFDGFVDWIFSNFFKFAIVISILLFMLLIIYNTGSQSRRD
jgi:hypothetical protein